MQLLYYFSPLEYGKPLIPSASNVILTPQTNLILFHIKKHGHVLLILIYKQDNESYITEPAFLTKEKLCKPMLLIEEVSSVAPACESELANML